MSEQVEIVYEVKGTRHVLNVDVNLNDFYKWSPMRKHRHFRSIGVKTYGKNAELISVIVKTTGEQLYAKSEI